MRAALAHLFWNGIRRRLARSGQLIVRPDFYSPMGDAAELAADAPRLWPARPSDCLGIDFNEAGHRELLGVLSGLAESFDYPEQDPGPAAGCAFFTGNLQFGDADARVLYAMLQHLQPKRVIEVGSGYSSALMADVNRRLLGSRMRITAIEPYPRSFLKDLAGKGALELREARVQDVPADIFGELGGGDVLFIDSSHVAKTGSDVNHLVFEALPRLAPGVFVHFHDIHLPFEYPREWVLEDNRSWNEQYIVRALLMFAGEALRVYFSSAYAYARFGALPRNLAGTHAHGGSLWLRRG